MKNSSKKFKIIFRLENSCTSVILRLNFGVSEFLYSVEVRSHKRSREVMIINFHRKDDAESYIFENYGYMIIPTRLCLLEGTRLFVY